MFCVSLEAHSEKWINVGTAISTTNGNADIYADADSAKRNGDIASVRFKSLVEPKIDEMSFDCEKNLIFWKFGDMSSTNKDLTGKGGTVTWPVSLMKKLQSVACKKSYEFWKQ